MLSYYKKQNYLPRIKKVARFTSVHWGLVHTIYAGSICGIKIANIAGAVQKKEHIVQS